MVGDAPRNGAGVGIRGFVALMTRKMSSCLDPSCLECFVAALMNALNEQFGTYTLVERIALGGMAEVFLARRSGIEGFEKEIVIKRIRPHLGRQKAFVNMFLGEAKLAAQLSHSNIVQIYDLGRIEESYFIAMEYIAGRDMSAILPKAKKLGIPFPVEYALKVASSVCEALNYAHSKTNNLGQPLNIVHRDISPENIRVAWSGDIKILDFGIAKAATQLHETKAGEIKGKLCYMAPEQVLGKSVDQRSDVFSMGVVLYELLTGLKLYTGSNELDIMNKIVDAKIHPPSYFREGVPEEVEAIVLKALEKDRAHRYQSASDLQYDIDSFLAGHEFTPSSTHLANFVKQLFRQELAEEHLRRQHKGASALPAAPQATTPSGPQITSPEKTVELALPLDSTDYQRLQNLAAKNSSQPTEIALDILRHYLKYQN